MSAVPVRDAVDATPSDADDAAWDARVERADPGSYLQLSAWARVKAVNGWRAVRLGHETGPEVVMKIGMRLPGRNRPCLYGLRSTV